MRPCDDPLITPLLAQISLTCGIRLMVDGSKVGAGHQLLMVSVAYRHRALPVAWTWVKGARGHSAARVQVALLAHVHRLLSPGAQVLLVGDSEFGAVEVLRQVEKWQWQYVLRQKASHLLQLPGQDWQAFGTVLQKAGQSPWLGAGLLTQTHAHPTHLVAHWARQEKLPWLFQPAYEISYPESLSAQDVD